MASTDRSGSVPRATVGAVCARSDSGAAWTHGADSSAASWARTTSTSGLQSRGATRSMWRESAGRSRVMTASSASRSAAAVAPVRGAAVAPAPSTHPVVSALESRSSGTSTVVSPWAVATDATSDGVYVSTAGWGSSPGPTTRA